MATNGADLVQISAAPTQAYNLLGGVDTLEMTATTNFDASGAGIQLTSVEILKADVGGTTFLLNQADISSTPGSIVDVGGGGTVELASTETLLDLTHTTLSGISAITDGGFNTTFMVDLLDVTNVAVHGSSGGDTLIVKGTNIDLTSTDTSSVETLKVSSNSATTFVLNSVNINELSADQASIVGGAGKDTLKYASGGTLDLSSISLSSIEILKAGSNANTTFTVNQADLTHGGSIIGSAGSDTIAVAAPDTSLDLTSTTLSSIENLNANTSVNTALTVDSADLNGLESVHGFHSDSLTVKGTAINLANTALDSIASLSGSAPGGITFTLSTDTVNGSVGINISGSNGTDTIVGVDDTLDLRSANLSSIEILKTTEGGLEFMIKTGDLKAGGGSLISIIGSNGNNELFVYGTVNLTSTVLSSIEYIAGSDTIILDQADLAKGGTVDGEGGSTLLQVTSAVVDLSQTTLTNGITQLEGINDGSAETFKLGVNAIVNGTIAGSTATDQIIATGSLLDLSSTVLSSIEKLSTSFAGGTEFIVTEAELTAFGSNISGSKGTDSLVLGEAGATQFDLTTTTLSGVLANNSIEKVGVETGTAADILITHAELLKLKGFIGGDNGDTLAVTDSTDFNLTSATLDDINELIGTSVGTRGTTFTLDANDLGPSLGTFFSITGTAGALDTVAVKSTTIDLSGTNLSSIEVVKSTITNSAVTFKVGPDTLDNSPAIAFDGNAGKNDTIQMVSDLTVDFSSATFSSIEILKYDTSTGDDIIIKDSFLAANGGSLGSVVAGDNNDVLEVAGTAVNFLSTTLTGIDQLQVNGTTITLDQTDILNGSKQTLEQIIDNANAPGTILQVKSAIIDLSQTTLSGIDVIKSFGQAAATPITFKLSGATLADQPNGPVQFVGGGGTDTIQAVNVNGNDGFVVDLSNADMSSIEVLKTDSSSFTEFDIKDTVLAANAGGSVTMVVDRGVDSAIEGDTLGVFGANINLTGTALSGIEYLAALDVNDATFTLDQTDLFAKSGTKVTQELFQITGNIGNDTLAVKSNTIDLSNVALSSIETIRAATGVSGAVTFIVDDHTLAGNDSLATIAGGASSDTVSVLVNSTGGIEANLLSTDFSSIETLQVNAPVGGDFIVDINGYDIGGATNVLTSVVGVGAASAFITLDIQGNTDLDLSSTSFSNIDRLDLASGGNSLIIGTNTLEGPMQVKVEAGGGGQEDLHLASGGGTSFDISQVNFEQAGAGFSGLTMDDGGNSVNVIVSQDNLTDLTNFTGTAQDDTLTAAGTQLDLLNSSAVLTSIEGLATNNTGGTTFTVSQDHLNEMSASAGSGFGSITGNSGNDTLVVDGTGIDLTSTTLSSVETLRANESGLTILIDNADNLASLKTIDGDEGTFTAPGSGASLTLIGDSNFDLSHTSLSGIAVLSGDSNGSGVTFTLDQADIFTTTKAGVIQQLTEIDGDGDTTVTDTILAHGTVLDLHGVTLSGIEDISADHSSGVRYTLDGNASGIDLDLMTGTGKNTVTLNAGYDGVIDNTSESTVLATTLTIDNFTHGQDTIDLSHVLTNGTATFDSTAGAQGIADTAAGGGGDLHDILNALQNTYDGSTNSQVLKFEYNGDTYLMVDNAASGNTFDPADSVVKLSGTGLGVAASDLVVH